MGKVKGEEKFPNEVAVNRRRKKRKKELDILRRNVLEAKRKLREKTAPPKTHISTFNKILNSFADRRQDNDNKTQGFDSKGRRAGLKKICNRLLPSRKPQVGIFANGAKGAEIKRVNLPLTELDRARFEGDLQKVLNDGKRKPKESRSDALNKTLHRPLADTIDMETQMFIQMPAKKLELEHEPAVQNFLAERQSSKRKMPMVVELDRKTAKKPHSERIDDTNVIVDQYNKLKTGCKISRDKKWKRSLFQDDMQDEFESMSAEPGLDQLRFSPTTDGDKVKDNSAVPKVFPDIAGERPAGTKRLNFNYGQLGRMAATKYEELCTMVCAENFETCLQEIPHIDPLEKVKQSLINFYDETCNQKALRNNAIPEVRFAEESSSTSSHLIDKNTNRNEYFYKDGYIERSRSETVNDLPPRGVCLGKLKKFPNREAEETSSVQSKPLITKGSELKKRKFIPCLARGPPSTETSIAGYNGSSLDVNYDSSRKIFRSDILEFFKINEESEPVPMELENTSTSRLSGISSQRKKTMSRYIRDVNNSETAKKYPGSNFSQELSAVSAENNDIKKCYLGDPLRRHEMRTKQIRNSPERKLGEMYGPPFSEGGIEEDSRNSFDVNCDSLRTCLGLNLGEFPKIEGKSRPTIVNLGCASRSTLASIPSDRGEFMLKFLQGVNNPAEPMRENRTTLPPEVFIVVPENNKLPKRYLDNPSRRHQIKNIPIDRPSKNERHVPAILRKSHTTKRNKKSNTAGTVLLAKGKFKMGDLGWKNSNFNFQKLTSPSEATSLSSPFDNGQTLRNPPPIASRFPIDSDNHINPDRLDLMKRMSQTSQFHNQTAEHTETPKIINALYDANAKAFEVEPNFMNERFPCKAESAAGQHDIAKASGSVNYQGEFKLESATNCHHQNSVDDVVLSNFHNVRQSQNLPIFLHQQRPDARIHRGACDEKKMESLGSQDSQRFPVFLKRKTIPTSQNRIRYEEQHLEPKVIIIQNPRLRGIGEEVRHEINIPCIPDRIESKNPQPNGSGLHTFSKFPRVMQMAPINSVQFQNGTQNIQQFRVPDNTACQNVGQQVEHQIPRCLCKTDLQNVQHMHLPNIVCQNGMARVVNHKYTVQELGNNPMNFFEPKTFDVPISQRMFHHDLSSHGQIPASCTSSYCGNTNFETQRNCNPAEPVQLFDKRFGFLLPKNETEPFCQSAINLPIISDQISHRQDYSPRVLPEDTNRNYKYIIDPRCPQGGYQWNQIDQSGAQIHQRVIQPAYNVPDAYRPQIPHAYFSTDT